MSSVTKPFRKVSRPELEGSVTGDNFKVMGWVTLRDFCEKIAEISYQTGLIWCKQERIKFVQVGGVRRIYEDEIRRFLREGTLPPNEEIRSEMARKHMDYRIRTGRYKPKGSKRQT